MDLHFSCFCTGKLRHKRILRPTLRLWCLDTHETNLTSCKYQCRRSDLKIWFEKQIWFAWSLNLACETHHKSCVSPSQRLWIKCICFFQVFSVEACLIFTVKYTEILCVDVPCFRWRKTSSGCSLNTLRQNSYKAKFYSTWLNSMSPLRCCSISVLPERLCQQELWAHKIIVASQLRLDMLTCLLVGSAADRRLYIFIFL